MARPGFVLEVDDRTPPLMVTAGPRIQLERFPLGTEVVYPPEPLPRLTDPVAAIDAALTEPLASEPLSTKLWPGMRLTIAFDDVSSVPPLPLPDIRGRIVERVLTQAAAAGVDDVALICANGLARRNTEAELRRILGERVFRSFYTDGKLGNHDAEDGARLTVLKPGGTDRADGDGSEVAINSRAADSDLLIMVHLAQSSDRSGTTAITQGLGSRDTVAAERSLAAVHDPDHTAARRAADIVGRNCEIFSVEAVLDNTTYGPPFGFLGQREWEWTLKSQAMLYGVRRAAAVASFGNGTSLPSRMRAGYAPTQVRAGAPAAVAEASREQLLAQQQVEVTGQADVLVLGVPPTTADSVDSVVDPLQAAWQGLAPVFGSVTGQPLVRPGGTVIVHHPLQQRFSTLHHPSSVDFFADVLPATTDAAAISDRYEQTYAHDPWYVQLYRTALAFHGLHPFHRWYEMAPAIDHSGDVIFVGADRRSADRMGFRAASRLADALEMASASVGRTPSVRYLHTPPQMLGTVT